MTEVITHPGIEIDVNVEVDVNTGKRYLQPSIRVFYEGKLSGAIALPSLEDVAVLHRAIGEFMAENHLDEYNT